MLLEPHTHDGSVWCLPNPVEWAPEGDSTVSARLLAAAKDQCTECLPGLTTEAAQNGDTLAVVILLIDTVLGTREGRQCVPGPELQAVFTRIKRMRNAEKPAVVGMLRTLSAEQRYAVATDCTQAAQDYITAVYAWADSVLLKRQQRSWWMSRRSSRLWNVANGVRPQRPS